jgi:hypothetical protein
MLRTPRESVLPWSIARIIGRFDDTYSLYPYAIYLPSARKYGTQEDAITVANTASVIKIVL